MTIEEKSNQIDQDMNFVSELNIKIWKTTHDPYTHRAYQTWHNEARNLTDEEWDRVVDCVLKYDLAVEMINACMGFGCGIRIYCRANNVDYKWYPNNIITITQNHIKSKDEEHQKSYGHMSFDEAWNKFSNLVDNEKNKRLLKEYGLPELKEKSHYEY